jgi:hypothetical protein
MSKRLMGTRNVPEDELDELRDLFETAGIAIHETPPGPLGITAGGLWVVQDDRFPEAQRLFASYQQDRASRARAEHEAAQREGRAATFLDVLRSDPSRVLAVLAGVLFLLGLSVLPYFLLRA